MGVNFLTVVKRNYKHGKGENWKEHCDVILELEVP